MLCISFRQGMSRESRVYQRYLGCPQLFLQDNKDNFGRQTEVMVIITDVVVCLYSKDILSNIYIQQFWGGGFGVVLTKCFWSRCFVS